MRNPCEKFERRLQRLVDLRRTVCDDARLARHASECDDCRQTLAAHAWLAEETGRRQEGRDPLAERAMARRIASRVLTSVAPISSNGASVPHEVRFARVSAGRWKTVALLAAAIMLVVWSASHRAGIGRRDRAQGLPSVAVQPHRAPALEFAALNHAASMYAASDRPIDAGTRRRVQLLAAETGGQLAAAARRLPGLGASQASLESMGRPGSSDGAESSSLKAWTDSMSAALERWFEAVPEHEQTSRS